MKDLLFHYRLNLLHHLSMNQNLSALLKFHNIALNSANNSKIKSRSSISLTFVHKMFLSSFVRSQNYYFFLQVTKYFFSSYLITLIFLVLRLQSNKFIHLNAPSISFYLFLHFYIFTFAAVSLYCRFHYQSYC